MLIRHGLFKDEFTSIFDYGCGRGDDVETLRRNGFQAHGWDPHFANDHLKFCCDLVNLGFVINVIEDSAERVEALHLAFKLAKRALVFGVMLHPSDLTGVPFQDGVLTSRSTFQKYFTQSEIKAYVEDVLQTEVYMVGPGVGLVFADKVWQQAFESSRYRSGGVARRLRTVASLSASKPARARSVGQSSQAQKQVHENRGVLDRLWLESLDLGRFPEKEETTSLHLVETTFGTLRRAIRLLMTYCDMSVLEQARKTRIDDLTVYFAIQQFSKRGKYRYLEPRIQRDIKAFFGDHGSAQSTGYQVLIDCANPERLSQACVQAASEGLGWLEEGRDL
jgi:DNA phosphorothioation-associated putative methyltransferase